MNALKPSPSRVSRSVRRLRALALALVAVFALQLLDGPVAYADGGREIVVLEQTGTCQIERGGSTFDAQQDMRLLSGDVIVTGEGSGVRLRIDRDKSLYLDSSTRVLLVAEGTAECGRTLVFVERGAVLTEVMQKLSDDSSFDVVTPNTTMSIHGTKTLTEVLEDVLGAIKTNAAVIEGNVRFAAIQKDEKGNPVIADVDLGVGQGLCIATDHEDLLAPEDVRQIVSSGPSAGGGDVDEQTLEELGAMAEPPAFSEEFLTNVVAVLARSREEDLEEGFAAESVTEEELNAALEVLNDVIQGRVSLPDSVAEYIESLAQPYYSPASEPLASDPNPSIPDPAPPADNDPPGGGDPIVADGDDNLIVNDDYGDDNGNDNGDDVNDDDGNNGGGDDDDTNLIDTGDDNGDDDDDDENGGDGNNGNGNGGDDGDDEGNQGDEGGQGTKSLIEVIKDVVANNIRTGNAVSGVHVKVKAAKVKADGTVVSVERDLGAGDGNAFSSAHEELVSPEEMQAIAGTGASVSVIKVEIVSEEEEGIVFSMVTFDGTYLESIKTILIADAEVEAGEEGLSEEQTAAINTEVDEIRDSLEAILEESQNAINAAADVGVEPEPNPEPEPDPIPEIPPDPQPGGPVVPGGPGEDDSDGDTSAVDGDTNLINIGDDDDDDDDDIGVDDNYDNDDDDDDDGDDADDEDDDNGDAEEEG